MGTVTFTLIPIQQAAPGEAVTFTITKPDTTTTTVTLTTDANGAGSVGYSDAAGDYSAKAHVDEDAQFKAADSPDHAFTEPKDDRTIDFTIA